MSQNLKTLLIEGADVQSSLVLKQIHYKQALEDSLVQRELVRISRTLDQIGFINHQIEYIKDSISHYRIKLNSKLDEIQISYSNKELDEILSHLKQVDKHIVSVSPEYIHSILTEITNFYSNNGYGFAQVRLKNLKLKSTLLKANLEVKKDQYRKIDRIVTLGYPNFPKSILSNKLNIKVGSVFNKKEINSISGKLKQLPFVSEVKTPRITFTKDSTILYLYLKRKKSNSFDGMLGFSYQKERKGLTFNGKVNLSLVNVLNKGESLSLNWMSDGNNSQSLNLSLVNPYIKNTKISTYYSLELVKKDSSFVNISHKVLADYQFREKTKLGIVLENLNSNSILNIDNYKDFKKYFYGITYEFRLPSYNSYNKDKWYIYSLVSKGTRNKNKQSKLELIISYYQNLTRRQGLFFKNTTHVLQSDNYLGNEMLWLGGYDNIRGFEDNSIPSLNSSLLSVEYNYNLGKDSFLVGLTDFAIVSQTKQNTLQKYYSFGIGYHYTTKFGRLGLIYAIGNTIGETTSLNNGKLHISLSQVF